MNTSCMSTSDFIPHFAVVLVGSLRVIFDSSTNGILLLFRTDYMIPHTITVSSRISVFTF